MAYKYRIIEAENCLQIESEAGRAVMRMWKNGKETTLYMNKKEKRKLVLEYIKNYIYEHQYAPTIREICQGIGVQSTGTVQGYMQTLFHFGDLETDLEGDAARAYRLSKRHQKGIHEPWIGIQNSPEESEWVWVTLQTMEGNTSFMAQYKDQHFYVNGEVRNNVQAWMRMQFPEPYEKG